MISTKNILIKYDKALNLLIQAQILSLTQLEEVRGLAEIAKYPINRMLESTGIVTSLTLKNAYQAIKQITEGQIENNAAIEAIKYGNLHKIDFAQAVQEITDKGNIKIDFELFLNLLLDSNLLNIEQLQEAYTESNTSNLAFSRILITMGLLPEFILNCLIEILVDLKQAKINYAEACSLLAAGSHNPTLIINNTPKPKKHIKLGELLAFANIISTQDNQDIIFESLITGNLSGQLFVNRGLVSLKVLNCALEIQELINKGNLPLPTGLKMLEEEK